MHIFKGGLLRDDESDLSKLSSEQETIRVAECVSLSADVDIAEERERADNAVLVHRIIRHFHVPGANGLTLDTTEVDGLFLRVILDDLDDGETVNSEKMGVSSIPDGASGRRAIIEFHSHSRFLRTLASEDVGSRGLGDLGSTLENFHVAIVVGLHFDDHVSLTHTDVFNLDVQFLPGKHHIDERNLVSRNRYMSAQTRDIFNLRLDSFGAALRNHRLQVFPTCRTGPHTVGNGSRQGGEVGEVRVDVNRVEVLGNVRVVLIGEGGRECGGGGVGHGVSIVGKVGDGTLGASMALNVCDDWVSVTIILLKVHITNLDEPLDLITDVDISGNGDRVIGNFALKCVLGLQTENERGARRKRLRGVAQLEPLLREDNVDGSICRVFHHVVGLLDDLEGVFIIREAATVEEGRGDFDDGLSLVGDVTDNLDGLPGVGVDNGSYLRLSFDDVADVEGGGTVEHAETVGKVNQVEEVAIDRLGENRFHNSLKILVRVWGSCSEGERAHLPSSNNTEIHRRLHSLIPRRLKRLALVTYHVAESLDVLCGDGDLGAMESLSNTDGWEGLVVAEPEAPIEVLDAQVATVCNFVDRNGTERGNVVELHG
jgi:hypothetical protein